MIHLFDRFGLALRQMPPPDTLRAAGMIAMPQGLLVFGKGAPAVLYRVSWEGRWKVLPSIEFAADWALVSGDYADGRVYFLTDHAQVLVCEIEDEPVAP